MRYRPLWLGEPITMPDHSVSIRYEQAVYGSFPFWDRGYAILAQSAGCRPDWLEALRSACQRLGERPASAAGGGLFALRVPKGPWMIVGIGDQGRDDRGRPGALAFHALFLSPREYRKTGFHPFAVREAFRNDWSAETRELPAGEIRVKPIGPSASPVDPRATTVAAALAGRHRVAIETDAPIDALAAEVWRALPGRVRARASLATWAFSAANRFDLLGAPRLAGLGLDASYRNPETFAASAVGDEPRGFGLSLPRWMPYLGIAAVAAGVGLGLALRQRAGSAEPSRESSPTVEVARDDLRPPDRSAYSEAPADAEDVERVADGLAELAERFRMDDPASAGVKKAPAATMTLLADRLRYRGRVLSRSELVKLANEPSPDHRLALLWHERVVRFLPDRRLPDGFERGPLRWQLDTLAWAFHLDAERTADRRAVAELPHALADALALDVPLRPTALAADYPALADYAAFLGRLPRR